MLKIFLSVLLLSAVPALGQIGGCTDPQATNYNPAATYNNGSCTYASASYSLSTVATLPAELNEISGMVYYNGKIYGHQDSGGPTNVYEVDPSTGNITKTIILDGVSNVDWEDMTQDDTHFYIGDVGNNASGNRTDLKIYKFPKSAISAGATITVPAASIEVINFAYEDQTDFSAQPANSTAFDCEAIAFNRGKLHLFTKNWIGSTCAHYVLPTTAGTYSAAKKDEINTANVKITGADFGAWDLLVLIGYEVTGLGNAALFLDYGFDGTYFYLNTGCRRRLNLGTALSNGQLEGVAFVNALHGYASNEKFNPNVFVNIPQSLRSFNILNYIQDYYNHNQQNFGDAPLPQAGTIRFNGQTLKLEGYDGTHWNPFH